MSASPILETRRLTKRFGGFIANRAVDFSVAAGEIRGIIGPNGAGKTTLVNMICGSQVPSEGDILLDGASILKQGTHARARAGLVRSFQVCRVFGDMTLLENLIVPALAQGIARDVALARAETLLALTRLAPLAAAKARALSGGQRVLLQVAAGFMVPTLRAYVLDEPFAGINPVIKDTIIDLILHERQARAMTFVIVSHEMEVMRRLCDRITVMIEGAIFREGPLAEVVADPRVIEAYLGKALA